MRFLEGHVDGMHVIVMHDGDDKPCHLYVEIEAFGAIRVDDTFPNALKLSAFLACELGYGPAADFLHDHRVPADSRLWHLNHGGWCPDRRVRDGGHHHSRPSGR